MVTPRPVIHEDLGLDETHVFPCYKSKITYMDRVGLSIVDKHLVETQYGIKFRLIEDRLVMHQLDVPDNTPIVNENWVLIGIYRSPMKPKSWLTRILETLKRENNP